MIELNVMRELERAVIDVETGTDWPVGILIDTQPRRSHYSAAASDYCDIALEQWEAIKNDFDPAELPVSSSDTLYVLPLRIPNPKDGAPRACVWGVGPARARSTGFLPRPIRAFGAWCTSQLAILYSDTDTHTLIARAFQAGAAELGLELIRNLANADASMLWLYRHNERIFESYAVSGMPDGQYDLPVGKGIVGHLTPTLKALQHFGPDSVHQPFHPDLFSDQGWQQCQAFSVCCQGALLGAISLYWRPENFPGFLSRDETSALGDLVYGFLAHELAELTMMDSEVKFESLFNRLGPASALLNFMHDVQPALREANTAMNAAAVVLSDGRGERGRSISRNLVQAATFIDACMNRMGRLALLNERTANMRRVDLRQMLLDNKTMYEMHSSVRVTVVPGSAPVYVKGDRLAIERALLNLVSNAVYWTEIKLRGERRVMITLGSDSTEARVSVEDTGVGIGPEIKDRILDKFVTGRSESGTGLGLATVNDTMKLHGGRLRYANNPNHGATFVLIFPKAGGHHGA